jgi:hypothetical protein
MLKKQNTVYQAVMRRWVIFAFLFVLILAGCKKNTELLPQNAKHAEAIASARNYFQKLPKNTGSRKTNSTLNGKSSESEDENFYKFDPDWDKTVVYTLKTGEILVVSPVVRNIAIQYGKMGFLRKLVTVLDANQKPVSAQIMEVVTEKSYLQKYYNKIYEKLGNNDLQDFNGALLIYTTDYEYIEGYRFKNGYHKTGIAIEKRTSSSQNRVTDTNYGLTESCNDDSGGQDPPRPGTGEPPITSGGSGGGANPNVPNLPPDWTPNNTPPIGTGHIPTGGQFPSGGGGGSDPDNPKNNPTPKPKKPADPEILARCDSGDPIYNDPSSPGTDNGDNLPVNPQSEHNSLFYFISKGLKEVINSTKSMINILSFETKLAAIKHIDLVFNKVVFNNLDFKAAVAKYKELGLKIAFDISLTQPEPYTWKWEVETLIITFGGSSDEEVLNPNINETTIATAVIEGISINSELNLPDWIYEDADEDNPQGTPFTLNELKRVALEKGLDWNVQNDRFKIADLFESAFFDAVNSTKEMVLYNDTKIRRDNKTNRSYETSVRDAKVSPDGIGSTGWRPISGQTKIYPETAFYEVKAGGTTLDANYSTGNEKQLLGMLDALTKRNVDANFHGTPTLFLITVDGTPVNLTTEAKLYGVNLVQITPTLLANGDISFSNAKILYAVPGGPLTGYVKGIKLPFFNTPVPIRWNKVITAYDGD